MTTKPDLNRVWAEGAPPSNIEDPDVTSPGKFDAGWTAEIPPFENFNFLQQLFTQALAHANEYGIMQWDTATPYPEGAWARSTVDSKVYELLSGGDPTNEPSVSPTDWANVNPLLASSDNAIARFNGVNGKLQNSIVAIDDNGNMAIADNFYGWQSYTGVDLKILSLASGISNGELGFNFYYDGVDWRFKTAGYATRIGVSVAGTISFYVSTVSGVADTIITWSSPTFEIASSGEIIAGPIGSGQSWVDVTASRTAGVTYTNTTGQAIMVVISRLMSTGTNVMLVDGLTVSTIADNGGSSFTASHSVIVPAGSTYSITVPGSSVSWYELR